ncbi:BRCT domain-containing protein [Pseudoalteromonas sp. PPB1]|uniref:BRCT domain-containing protein n=1 Tax=Pseudoalteromonas sp. PPB1 TaxID=2756136 RepID=UPI001E4CD87D|nr:BRCT domain-containing protein [Pseudoalteromonas sp. PPB1]
MFDQQELKTKSGSAEYKYELAYMADMVKRWKPRARASKQLICETKRVDGDYILKTSHWKYKVLYGHREALGIFFAQRIEDKKPVMRWTQKLCLNFKAGDLYERRDGLGWIQVFYAIEMGWDMENGAMHEGTVTYDVYGNINGDYTRSERKTCTQMEFLELLITGGTAYKGRGIVMQTEPRSTKKHDRVLDTLIGLAKGLIADGNVNQAEAEFLQVWLVQNMGCESPILTNLLDKVSDMLSDGKLDENESSELLQILGTLCGDAVELGEVAKPASLPLCQPAPPIEFKGHNFVLTGSFAHGSREECENIITQLGGNNEKLVTKRLDYLVVGTYVTDTWAHEGFGRKIEKAMEYRDSGAAPIKIVSEEHWLKHAGLKGH